MKETIYKVKLARESFEIGFNENLTCVSSESNSWMVGKNISFIQVWVDKHNGSLAIIPYKKKLRSKKRNLKVGIKKI